MNEKMPEIYCALSIELENNVNFNRIVESLKMIGVHDTKVVIPKSEPLINLDFAIVDYEQFWYLDDALTKMFSKIHDIKRLKTLVNECCGHFFVDIAFYQYGTYPALEFKGENMSKIRFLNADIIINAY